jgi:hypothetical protein
VKNKQLSEEIFIQLSKIYISTMHACPKLAQGRQKATQPMDIERFTKQYIRKNPDK